MPAHPLPKSVAPGRPGRVCARAVAWAAALGLAAGFGAEAPPADGTVDFLREVRPVLAGHCFKCHGPDEAARQAGLRLDTREGALQVRAARPPALVPGQPDRSELVRRVFASTDREVMPPPAAHLPLTAAQKEILRRWVAQGAEYRPHWAFAKPLARPLPEVRRAEWAQNEIDRFVLARLEREGLAPAEAADRYTLARRVSLDLIGLPPTPEEADAFANDPSPQAYERWVDRLLASPHYGERWARPWMDLARYADTNGFEKDRPRSIWAWRDWLIQALNADLPFDRFTVEQLAGDLLTDATAAQRIATGFHRNSMLNEEGGADPQEYRFYAAVDRVNVTATTWLGLTMACAQCHTHKFEPITQREYYRFMAFLNNADEPLLEVPASDLAERRRQQTARIAALTADLTNQFPVELPCLPPLDQRRQEALAWHLAQWLAREAPRVVAWRPARPASAAANIPTLDVEPDDSVFVSGDFSKSDTYSLRFTNDWRGARAVRLEVLSDPRLPEGGPGRVAYEGPNGNFWLSNFKVRLGTNVVKIAAASQSFAEGENTAAKAVDDDLQSGWSINGGQGRSHNAVFRFDRPLDAAGEVTVEMLFEKYYAAGVGRFRLWFTREPDAVALPHPNDIHDGLLRLKQARTRDPNAAPGPEDLAALRQYFAATTTELRDKHDEIARLTREMPKFPTTVVLQERPPNHTRPTFVHQRGEFLQPTERVEPGVPAALPDLPAAAPRNRLGLARWLVSPDNPLTARVAMNRRWQAYFGRGLVRTTEDFGFQGELPTHPELLDWLALEFVRRGWSLKQMDRLIVLSATYRQSSRTTPALRERDPENLLLARGPRFRLEAELVRDAALQASGLLSDKIGGPSVYPPQSAGVTTEGTYGPLPWKTSEGPDRYRRGIYTFAKRTAPFALFNAFDAPSGEACLARRDRSDTPLQALMLLNDAMFQELARAMGQQAAEMSGTVSDRAARLFRRCLTRPPSPEELGELVAFYEKQRARFASGALKAGDFLGTKSAPDSAVQAAWAALARVLLNLDEAVTKS